MCLVFTHMPGESYHSHWMYIWWSLCTLYLLARQVRVTTATGCTSGGVYVPCIYSDAQWELHRWLRSLLLCLSDIFWVLWHLVASCEDVPQVEFMYLVFTRMPGESYHSRWMYLWWSLCTMYLLACYVRVTIGNSGLCCLFVWWLLNAN